MGEGTPVKPIVSISLRLKLLLTFTLLFAAVFSGAFYWFDSFATDMAISRIQEDLTDTVVGAAAGVDGDALVTLALDGEPNAEGFSDDPRYVQQLDWLDTVQQIEPRAWPYTYVAGEEENQILFIGDLYAWKNPDKAAKFKEPLTSKGPMLGGLSALTYREDEQGRFTTYTDKWGSWVSAYAPVKNSEGDLVGGIGVDFRADYVDQVRQGIREKIVLAFAIVFGSLFILVFIVSRTFTRPVVALTAAAERIGEGDYEQELGGLIRSRFPDEISTLAQVFQIMVGKVYQREQTLIRRVEELRIEIDETKRQKQVAEIVDTDFFQTLQDKAQELRARRQSASQQVSEGSQDG